MLSAYDTINIGMKFIEIKWIFSTDVLIWVKKYMGGYHFNDKVSVKK